MADTNTNTNASTTELMYTGRVKWFNTRKGFGFITVTDNKPGVEAMSGQDIFVHHSGVAVDDEQYRYLVQGEYVSFTLSEMQQGQDAEEENDSDEPGVQAVNVRGVGGGKLMCETRKEMQNERVQYRREHGGDEGRSRPAVRGRSGGRGRGGHRGRGRGGQRGSGGRTGQ